MKIPKIPETDNKYDHDIWLGLKHCCIKLKEGGGLIAVHRHYFTLDPKQERIVAIGDDYHMVPINYCPWCGEKITS